MQRRIQNPAKYLRRSSFCENCERLYIVNYFRIVVNLRCFARFWIYLCNVWNLIKIGSYDIITTLSTLYNTKNSRFYSVTLFWYTLYRLHKWIYSGVCTQSNIWDEGFRKNLHLRCLTGRIRHCTFMYPVHIFLYSAQFFVQVEHFILELFTQCC